MGQSDKTKFFIFGQGRSGSTLLQHLLDAHPGVKCHGELFHEKVLAKKKPYKQQLIETFPMNYLSYCRQRNIGYIFGFKMLSYQFEKRENKLKDLFTKDWKIIHLRRNDIFNRCISELVARQSGIYFYNDNTRSQDRTILIEPESLMQYIKENLRVRAYEDRLLENTNCVKIIYEDMLENQEYWPATMEKIFHYLDTYNTPVTSPLKKTHPHPYTEIVSNYDELIQAVKASKFAYMLDDRS